MPSDGLMVKKSWLMGPRTSSILPMDVFCSMLVFGCGFVVGRTETYLVLEVYRRVEVRDLGVDALADYLSLAGVHKRAHLQNGSRRAKVALSITTASTVTTTSTAAFNFISLVCVLLLFESIGTLHTAKATTTTATATAESTAASRSSSAE